MNKTQWYDLASFDAVESILQDIFEYYFKLVEGTSCYCDKARYTARMLVKAFNDKTTYSLKMTYRECKDHGHIQEQDLDNACYWCPKTFNDTEDAYHIYRALIDPRRTLTVITEKQTLFNAIKESYKLEEYASAFKEKEKK